MVVTKTYPVQLAEKGRAELEPFVSHVNRTVPITEPAAVSVLQWLYAVRDYRSFHGSYGEIAGR
jgi:hypothetical protein